MTADTETEVRRKLLIRNSRGLHARAASKFVRAAATFEAEVWVMRADMVVSASSIMGLMMLGAAPGTEIELWARGADANAAMAELASLIERGFDEDTDGKSPS
jgi:phosphocarrier protein HPr